MTSKRDYSDVDSTTERIVGVFDVLGFRNSLKTIGTNKLVRSYAAAIGKAQAILQQTVSGRHENDLRRGTEIGMASAYL